MPPSTRPRIAGSTAPPAHRGRGGGTTLPSPPHSVGCPTQHAAINKTPHSGVHRASCPSRAGGTTLSSPPRQGCPTQHASIKHGGSGRRPQLPLINIPPSREGYPTAWGVTKASGYAPSYCPREGRTRYINIPPGTAPPACCSGRHLRTPLT